MKLSTVGGFSREVPSDFSVFLLRGKNWLSKKLLRGKKNWADKKILSRVKKIE